MRHSAELEVSLYSTDLTVGVNFDIENCGIGPYECHGFTGVHDDYCVTDWEIVYSEDCEGDRVWVSELGSRVLSDLEKKVEEAIYRLDVSDYL